MTETHLTTETHRIPTEKVATDEGTGGGVLVRIMKDAGVEVAFGVISIHNLPLVEAVARDLRFVPVRHEAAAVNAADAYGRASGTFGVAITSTGTGVGNAAGASLEALNASSRVLHITGNIDSTFLGEGRLVYHEVPRQMQMLDAVSRHAVRVEDAKQSARVLTEAVRLLKLPPFGPVSVDWPIDLQYTAHPGKQAPPRGKEPRRTAPRRGDVRAALRAMRKAKRPIIWAGGGATEVGPALTELAERWGAGVVTGANGRASIPEDHRLYIGNFPLAEEVAELLADADCLLTVGSHLRGNETSNFTLALPKRHVQIDVDPGVIGRNYPVTVGVAGDATLAVPELLAGLRRVRTSKDWPGRVAAAAEAARASHREQIGAYSDICDAMHARLPNDAVIVRDVTIPGSSWGNRLLRVARPQNNIHAAGGGIGQGLAMAVGAGIARPEVPTLAIVGDGGLAVHLGELATLAEQKPHVILTVFNDGGYGILRNMQEAKGGPRRAVDVLSPDFATLASAFGLPHTTVGDASSFDTALAEAVRREGPSVIEIDVPALHPQPEPVLPAVNVP